MILVSALSACMTAAILTVPLSTTEARADNPPVAHLLVANKSVQKGNLKAYCWTTALVIRNCYGQDFFVFPKKMVKAEEPPSILFDKPEPPDRIEIRYWTHIKRVTFGSTWVDRPRGRPRRTEAHLEPIIDADGLRWAAIFDLEHRGRVYIAAKAEWRYSDVACPACGQWATWAFSLRNIKSNKMLTPLNIRSTESQRHS